MNVQRCIRQNTPASQTETIVAEPVWLISAVVRACRGEGTQSCKQIEREEKTKHKNSGVTESGK